MNAAPRVPPRHLTIDGAPRAGAGPIQLEAKVLS
jgi:hypothetical protein